MGGLRGAMGMFAVLGITFAQTAADTPTMTEASDLLRGSKWVDAATAFEEILSAEPYNATALFNLGVAYESGGKTERAKEVFGRSVDAFSQLTIVNPNSSSAWYNLAYSLRAVGELDRALTTYEKAATFDEVRALAHYDRARIYAARGNADEAFAALRVAKSSGFANTGMMASEPDFERIRTEGRFARLLGYEIRKLKTMDGKSLEYALVLPDGFDESEIYPVLLAITGGAQDREAVDWGIQQFWGAEAARRGWIVISPIAPDGELFFRGGQRYIPELLDHIQRRFNVEGGRLHLAGRGSGGIAAFTIALDSPGHFQTLTTLPGNPVSQEELERIGRLKDLRINILLGEKEDRVWGEGAKLVVEKLKAIDADADARFGIIWGEDHSLPSMRNGGLIDFIDALRPKDPIDSQ